MDSERHMNEKFGDMREKIVALQNTLGKVLDSNDTLKVDLDRAATERMVSEQELNRFGNIFP